MENLNEGMGGSIENEFQDWLDIMLSEKGYEDEIETLKTVIDYAQDTLRDYSIDNWVPQTGGSTNENRKMENLNEGKKKASPYMAELAEIDKQSAIVAMEAKIDKLAEMVEAKTQRLSMVSEDENLSELIDKKRVKMMEREIKEIEKAKMKLEKLYEKMSGGKKKEVVKEEDPVDEGHDPGDDGLAYTDGVLGDYMNEEEIDEAHCSSEEDDVNEEVNRWQKLAGITILNEAKEIDMAKSFLENKGLKVEAVKSGNEGNDKAGKEGEAFIWNGGEGDMNYKSNGKEAFYVYMPYNEEILKEMQSKFPVIKVGGKAGKYYEVVIEKK